MLGSPFGFRQESALADAYSLSKPCRFDLTVCDTFPEENILGLSLWSSGSCNLCRSMLGKLRRIIEDEPFIPTRLTSLLLRSSMTGAGVVIGSIGTCCVEWIVCGAGIGVPAAVPYVRPKRFWAWLRCLLDPGSWFCISLGVPGWVTTSKLRPPCWEAAKKVMTWVSRLKLGMHSCRNRATNLTAIASLICSASESACIRWGKVADLLPCLWVKPIQLMAWAHTGVRVASSLCTKKAFTLFKYILAFHRMPFPMVDFKNHTAFWVKKLIKRPECNHGS